MKHLKLIFLLFFLGIMTVYSQDMVRPPLWGIAKITYLVSDFEVARDFYGRFLGFEEAFSYPSEMGQVIAFKVNDRQFLEFVEDKDVKNKRRMISVSFETEEVEQMHQYLSGKRQKVSEKRVDGAGNESFSVEDPSGNRIEFINLSPAGLHRQSKGLFLSDRRISKRIHHVGLYAEKINDEDPFYKEILKFKEIVRYPEDKSQPATILYQGMDDCTENIEHYSPNDVNVNHPCFLVDDMQDAVYILKERRQNEIIGKPMIGKGKRWIMNMNNSDGTRVEFTEAFCVN